MRFWFATIIFFSTAVLSACNKNDTNEAAWKKPETQTISCDHYFSEVVPQGILYNNVWNKDAAKSLPWSQCLEKNLSQDLYGWSWIWPNTKGNVIYAYPQIKLGVSPWAPAPKLETEFPLQSSNVRSLIVEHELDIQGEGEHNVATSFWLTNTKDIGDSPNPSTIIAELMIWSYATPGHMSPAGSHKGDFVTEGQVWEVWIEENWGDASGANQNKWAYITFRAKNYSLKTKFDVIKFTNYAIEQKILPKEFYISDVELGTEIMSGSGLVWVKLFNALVEK